MKKHIKVLMGCVFVICLLLGLGYLGLSVYYENGFSFQTYINGVYCTGKNVETVNRELNQAYEYEGLTVYVNNTGFYIDADAISYEYDYREPLDHYLKQQNPYLWIENLIEGRDEYELFPKVTYDQEALDQIIEDNISKRNLPLVRGVTLQATEDGFLLNDTKKNVLDESKLAELIKNALEEGKNSINPAFEDCFYDIPYSKDEEELLAFYESVNTYQSRQAVYHFGEEEEKLGAGELAKTLVCYPDFLLPKKELPADYRERYFDKEGVLLRDEDAIKEVLEDCFSSYNTYRNHVFTTHDGRVLTIKGGTYGNQINMKKERDEFAKFLSSDVIFYDRTAEYTREVPIKGKNDIGDTYIEVDIGQQKMFYYKEGELYLQTDVVTGKNHATREEVCYVYAKQKNRVLRGPGYASPVKFWMPVSGGIGIHDSSWRKEYGGDIYLKNGSHGCINTPLDIVEKMYEVVEVGTPCILYYGLEETD